MLPPEFSAPFTREEARRLGLHQRALHRLLAAGLCRKLVDGRYELVAPTDEVRLALTGLGPTAALSCESVAAFLDWTLPEPPSALHVSVPRSSTRRTWPGAVVHSRALAAGDTCVFMGVRLTTPEVTAVDLAAALPLRDAVVLLDTALRKGNVNVRALRRRLARRSRVPGITIAARAVRLADPRRQSPLESLFRVLCHEAGLPAPTDQFVVREDGKFLARVDFAWPAARLVVEIDGFEFHKEWQQFVEDRRRQNKLELAKWDVLRYSAADIYRRPERVVAEIRRALAQA